MNQNQRLRKQLDRQTKRLKKAERDRPTLLAGTVYLGTLGLLFILPVVGGAYLGRWLDTLAEGYSMHWTLNLIILGVMLGALNVYLFIRK